MHNHIITMLQTYFAEKSQDLLAESKDNIIQIDSNDVSLVRLFDGYDKVSFKCRFKVTDEQMESLQLTVIELEDPLTNSKIPIIMMASNPPFRLEMRSGQ